MDGERSAVVLDNSDRHGSCYWKGRGSGCLTVAYYIIKDQTTYQDLAEDFYDVNRLPHLKRYITKRLERLGLNGHITQGDSAA